MNTKNRIIAFIITFALMIPVFSATVLAGTNNSVPGAIRVPVDIDYSMHIDNAPMLTIKANSDIGSGAYFMLKLSPSAKWTLDQMATPNQYFTKGADGTLTSEGRLSNENSFSYSVSRISETDIEIRTKNDLPEDSYMLIPLIVKIDGVAEASVTVLYGEADGITGGTYVFANPGEVNKAEVEIEAKTEVSGNTIEGDILVGLSAGLGETTFEFTLPAGFNFDTANKTQISVVGEGSYQGVRIADIGIDSANTKLYVKIADIQLSTSPGRLTIKGIKVNALENAAAGDVIVTFSCFDLRNEKMKFGTYAVAEETPQEPAEEEKPATETLTINASATSGSKTVTINGEAMEMPTAPFNNQDGRMMVPIRFIANAFGIGDEAIEWNQDSRTVKIVSANQASQKEIVFTIDSDKYTVDGEEKQMDTAAVIKDGYTFVPVVYVAETFGVNVNYIPETKTAEFSGVIGG